MTRITAPQSVSQSASYMHLLRQQCLMLGDWRDAANGERLDVINPATGAVVGSVPMISQEETLQVIDYSQQAQKSWAQLTAKERSVFLLRWADLVLAEQDALASLMSAEQGKPLAEARGEVQYAASFITWFAEEAKRVDGSVLQAPQANQRLVVLKQPVGVCAAITPWNFPAAMITRKAAPALAAGCSMIVKPAEQTPLTALALAQLAEKAGIPAGVLQVITGEAVRTGQVLCDSAIVRKLSFTGSTEVGRILMAQCAGSIKKLSLELGGNAPFIVFDDADIEQAIAGIMASKFRNSGQTCVCANRIYVQSGVYEEVCQRLVAAVQQLNVGEGIQPGVTQGPLIDSAALEKVQLHLQDALQKGAKVLCGGQQHALGGTYFEPTVLRDATPDMLCSRQEIFGPVAPLFRFDDEAQAIAMANDTEYGLAAYLFTTNASRQWRVSEALEYGMVGVNSGLITNEVAPFGGIKQSGLGREGSRVGIDEYLELKYLCINLA